MNFSEQTFNRLAEYERYFRTACDADWCSNPGRSALATMCDALDEHDKGITRTPRDFNCGACQLRIVKRTGYLYFADKAEREAATLAEAKGEAAAAPEAPEPVKAPAKKTTAATAKKTGKK